MVSSRNNQADETQRLNVGCGRHFHPAWRNIDLVSVDPAVEQYDIRRGLPGPDQRYAAVYHSHVLEHLEPDQGRRLLSECLRVLKPGGVLRIVVPDLERIAELYLQMLRGAWKGDPLSQANYEWITLELLDQLVRSRSGGRMGPFMIATDHADCHFMQSRVGREIESCEPHRRLTAKQNQPARLPWRHRLRKWRVSMARSAVRALLGTAGADAFNEGLFRQEGEVHRWMYDRYSLRSICESLGFVDFRVCGANESGIEGFASFELDSAGDRIRKPDSLFVECRRPRQAAVSARAA